MTTFARMADPRGNVFSLFQNNQTPERLREFAEQGQEQMQEMLGRPVPGSYPWFEVGTTDAEATADFYRQAFGWRCTLDETAGGKQYHNVFTGNQWPSGGMYDLGADGVDYLMPDFLVTDVPAVWPGRTRGGPVRASGTGTGTAQPSSGEWPWTACRARSAIRRRCGTLSGGPTRV
ncbi:hypothetical protein ACH4YO_27710 [Streptomyces noursei]|uniref:hypothetical protein n=1 Tax=Streptomyces noursei TaxID=1971 RepID=UPI0033FCF50A